MDELDLRDDDCRRAGLGRADRAAARGRAAGSRRAARDPQHRNRRRACAFRRSGCASASSCAASGTELVPGQLIRISCVTRARRRRRRGLQRALPDTRVEGRDPRVPRARPDRARPPVGREDARGAGRARALGEAGARPLLGLRPDLLDGGRRAHGVTDPGRRPGGDRRGRRATSCRRRRARRSPSGSSASWPRRRLAHRHSVQPASAEHDRRARPGAAEPARHRPGDARDERARSALRRARADAPSATARSVATRPPRRRSCQSDRSSPTQANARAERRTPLR